MNSLEYFFRPYVDFSSSEMCSDSISVSISFRVRYKSLSSFVYENIMIY